VEVMAETEAAMVEDTVEEEEDMAEVVDMVEVVTVVEVVGMAATMMTGIVADHALRPAVAVILHSMVNVALLLLEEDLAHRRLAGPIPKAQTQTPENVIEAQVLTNTALIEEVQAPKDSSLNVVKEGEEKEERTLKRCENNVVCRLG